ncbi:transposase [Streptomyces bingchenggensis BCW-1]|uniref:Transposase n=1 Tax=Streptomyces bingchenggensis (strain BCW-1) TaxID=749414 RepID=D7CBJ9_STRBB|nr:transposase [Streptomyces bingchenggensis BCW-1]
MIWDGYKVHYSETCEDLPHLIVDVATTHATVDDSHLVATVHEHLARRGRNQENPATEPLHRSDRTP